MIIVLCVIYPPDEYNQLNLKLSMSTGKDIWEKCLTQPRTLRKLQKLMSFFKKKKVLMSSFKLPNDVKISRFIF